MSGYRVVLLVSVMMVALFACGEEFSIDVDKSELKTEAVQGSSPLAYAAVIRVTGEGPWPDNVFVGARVDGVGLLPEIQLVIRAEGSGTIVARPNTSLEAGSYKGRIVLLFCKDMYCNDHFDGSPSEVPYQIDIIDRLEVFPAEVSMTAVETGNGGTLSLDTKVQAIASVTYTESANWLTFDTKNKKLTLTADARQLLAGTYHAMVKLQSDKPRQMAMVPVTLVVTGALAVPRTVEVALTGSSVPADTTGSFAVQSAAGTLPGAWSADSDVPWLTLEQSSGASGSPLTWRLDLAKVSALENLATHVAKITVRAGAKVTPSTVELRLDKRIPEMVNVDRFALMPGKAGTAMVYGSGFQAMPHLAQRLSVAGAPAATVTVLSDRALELSLPALAAGEHAVVLSHPIAELGASRVLSVQSPVDRPYAFMNASGLKHSIIWDASSQSVFTVNSDLDSVMRFDVSQQPMNMVSRSIADVRSIGLTRDHSVLIALDGAGNLYDLDPESLQTIRVRSTGPVNLYHPAPIAITGDGLAWIPSSEGLAYDLRLSKRVASVDPDRRNGFQNGAVSPDGRRMLVTVSSSYSPPPPMLNWDTAQGQLNRFSRNLLSFFSLATTDRKGSRWFFNSGFAYGFDLASQGRAATPSGWIGTRFASSRDGTRLYAFAIGEHAIGTYSEPDPVLIFPRIYVFDTSAPPILSPEYPILGYFELPHYGSCLATQGPVACQPYSLDFTITDDDRTLLAVGDRRLLVIPIPAQYQAP
jgi:hypothetical protein